MYPCEYMWGCTNVIALYPRSNLEESALLFQHVGSDNKFGSSGLMARISSAGSPCLSCTSAFKCCFSMVTLQMVKVLIEAVSCNRMPS